jgi:hypothetical protein
MAPKKQAAFEPEQLEFPFEGRDEVSNQEL